MKKITIAELAKTAGVSTTSVTRYLKKEKVRSDIEHKIQNAIKETGYVVEENKEEKQETTPIKDSKVSPKKDKKTPTVKQEVDVEKVGKAKKATTKGKELPTTNVVEKADKNEEIITSQETTLEKANIIKKDTREELTKKFKGVMKKTGEMMGETKTKLTKSKDNFKKNMENAEISSKIKRTIEKTSTNISQKKNKVMKPASKNVEEKIDVQPLPTPKAKAEKVKPAAQRKRVVREKKGYTFAILTKDATNPRSRKTIKGIQSVCYDCDCIFSIFVGEGNAPFEEKCITAIMKQKVDAVIIESCANPLGIANLLKKAKIPCVFLNNRDKDIISLAVDETKAGEVIASYIMKMHHLIIRYLGADEALSAAHYEGIKKAYHDKKQPLDYAVKMCDGTYLDIYDKLKEIFDEKIDLVLLERDEMAIPLNKYLKEYHIAVPQNASVMSFGGHAITKVMSPTLASLAFDYNLYAEFVCDTLFAIMEGKTKPKMPEIYQIQEGDSVR